MTDTWIDKVTTLWASENISLSTPATAGFITTTEETIDFRFPEDFKEFYLKLDGFTDWEWTKNMFSIWPLARIIEYYNENDKNFIPFADYLINSHHVGFVKGKKGIFKNCGEVPGLIADTFSEAIFLINSDADILY
ncbi:SMI1/KNR4 family protein [Chryseobacterium arthrosphaerae]|uniref:SMI1/KNR4 family protein n=1 Tax=Chryseobacterium arthrosphaerae TaxID=651561 RepID=UPI001BAE8224|nr:SMI1/KNR4 family protein [Chryseobacterium arthrosphaerae]QUY54607.1 SMI1/KNR4 family protein [Chryseobacterium arthrosphaerae]